MVWKLCVCFLLAALLQPPAAAAAGGGGGGAGALLANDVKKQMAEMGGSSGGGGGGQGAGRRGARQAKAAATKAAIDEWIKSLVPATDYNTSLWKQTYRVNKKHPGQPGLFFAHYIKKFSEILRSKGAVVNFVLVGACDGTHDKTISEMYLPNSHWEGVFVEPVALNFNDLSNFLTEKQVLNRSHLLRAAATDVCTEPTTKIKFPVYETRSPNAPHWLRREIGAVLTPDEMAGKKPLPRNWNAEVVRCVTARDVLDDWSNATRLPPANPRKARNPGAGGKSFRRRPHVLKIDAEGHDYQVLMGFVRSEVPQHELPLLISFEAKSIRDHFNETVDHLRSRGYVVSDRADDGQITNDGFAMLRGDKIRVRIPGGGKRGGKKKDEGEEE